MSGITFIVHVQRPAAERNGSVVDDRAQLRCHFLTHQPRECGRLFAIEVGLQAMTDRLMQENARPAGAEYDLHGSGRRIDCPKLENSLPGAFASKLARIQVAGEDFQGTAAAAALVSR